MPSARVRAVGELLDLPSEHPLRVVHQVLACRPDGVDAVALEQVDETLSADAARGKLRLHVTDDELSGTDVVAQDPPDPVVPPALLLDLDRVELQPLGVRIRRVDDPTRARSQRAEVEVVRRRRRERDELAAVEDRHDEGDVWPVRRTVVGVVVDHDVARPPLLAELGEAPVDSTHVAGDGARLKRRRLGRLAELARLVVADRACRSPPTHG